MLLHISAHELRDHGLLFGRKQGCPQENLLQFAWGATQTFFCNLVVNKFTHGNI